MLRVVASFRISKTSNYELLRHPSYRYHSIKYNDDNVINPFSRKICESNYLFYNLKKKIYYIRLSSFRKCYVEGRATGLV